MSKERHPWFRARGYLHFDVPVGLKRAEKIVTNPSTVASHSFFPFIDFTVSTKKLFRDKESGILDFKLKDRHIAYAAHIDSHIYAYYGTLLARRYEEQIELRGVGECVLAFRVLGKSNIHFADQAFNVIKQMAPCSAVALDISGFFDNLDHQVLKQVMISLLGVDRLPEDYFNVFKSITKFSRVEKNSLYKLFRVSSHNPKKGRKRVCSVEEFRNLVRGNGYIQVNKDGFGIPQGSPISALLSNIYMLDFDDKINKVVSEMGGKYYRYCDDMLVIVPTNLRDGVEAYIGDEIKALKMTINVRKTELRDFFYSGSVLRSSKPLQYLGFLFDGERKLIRSSALARYSEHVKRGVRLAKLTQKKYNIVKFSRGEPQTDLYKRKLYQRYSHLGRRNFIRYGLRAADIMNSKAIKKQLKPLWKRLEEEIGK